uniref:Copia protein n=1 Tax=Cajanus cajan TaxID=3821 RepID=A0A151T2S0_CAJCA|nr:Copia protein [Cajanus cajan]
MQFLRGLNDQYNNVKSHVLLMEPLPPISKIFSYVVQQERQLLGQNFIANVHLDRTSSVNVVASPTCTHCNRTGHTDAVCFRKHGFPSTINRSNRGSSNRPQPSVSPCVNQIGSISSSFTKPSSSSGTSFPIVCSVISTPSSWILDSGATDHVSSSLSHFSSFSPINPIDVKLPTGQHVLATHSGIVKFTNSFYLVDVLYIPNFTYNLISISKLVSSLSCQLIFDHHSCIIQETNTMKKIGIVDVNGGLYSFTASNIHNPSTNSIIVHPKCSIQPIDLWHFRMGHLSHECLQLMKQSFPFLSVDKSFSCNTCHHAKQKKL